MANTALWYNTIIPQKLTDIILDDINNLKVEESLLDSKITDSPSSGSSLEGAGSIDVGIRNSKHSWISKNNWLGGFIWYYIMLANRENFLYDITEYQANIQYTKYEKGSYYTWHTDQDLSTIEKPDKEVRKLSFSLQLSNENEYSGGELQFKDVMGNTFFAPKNHGCLVIFDSRTEHRVCTVESGVRKSLVGWVNGPRWK